MKKYKFYLYTLLTIVVMLSSCRQDNAYDSAYVASVNLHLTYKVFGENKPFSTPLSMTLTNTTEQITYQRKSDLWGKFTLDNLLPGEYTINVIGSLTAAEASEATGTDTKKGAGLIGFISSVKLKQGDVSSLNTISLVIPTQSSLIFKELYYCGSRTPSNGNYRNDNFYTIYNNSDSPVLLNDIYITSTENYGGIGTAGPLWSGETQGEYTHVYLQTAWKIIAGEAPVFLQPRQSITIATMAAPHNKDSQYNLNSPVDLSNANYEAYSPDPSNKYADFSASNMERAFWPDYNDLWRISVLGQGMALIQATEKEFSDFEAVTLPESFQDPFESEEYWLCKKVPVSYVIDAVDLIQNNTTTITKRFPPSLDSGFATTGGTYSGFSVIRKVISINNGAATYQDSNNSTEDFEVNKKPLSK
jgi:hypothetical protein